MNDVKWDVQPVMTIMEHGVKTVNYLKCKKCGIILNDDWHWYDPSPICKCMERAERGNNKII
jgi:hypothetical protein